ncbi:hypothetical protein BGY98DRAFT_995527 [Russula aff. rugulosa BPL654]|nr:hypothetical protein BGY98DRAFT_995527 [Russula aff. rugulosa BPL654]
MNRRDNLAVLLIFDSTFNLLACLISCLSVKPLFNPPKKLVEVHISGESKGESERQRLRGTLHLNLSRYAYRL